MNQFKLQILFKHPKFFPKFVLSCPNGYIWQKLIHFYLHCTGIQYLPKLYETQKDVKVNWNDVSLVEITLDTISIKPMTVFKTVLITKHCSNNYKSKKSLQTMKLINKNSFDKKIKPDLIPTLLRHNLYTILQKN